MSAFQTAVNELFTVAPKYELFVEHHLKNEDLYFSLTDIHNYIRSKQQSFFVPKVELEIPIDRLRVYLF